MPPNTHMGIILVTRGRGRGCDEGHAWGACTCAAAAGLRGSTHMALHPGAGCTMRPYVCTPAACISAAGLRKHVSMRACVQACCRFKLKSDETGCGACMHACMRMHAHMHMHARTHEFAYGASHRELHATMFVFSASNRHDDAPGCRSCVGQPT